MMRLLSMACACLWLAACSSSSTSLSDRLVAPGGVSPLLDEDRIEATIASVPNRSGHVTSRDGVPIFWRAFDAGRYGLHYRYLGRPATWGMRSTWTSASTCRSRSRRCPRAAPWCCCTAG